MSLALRRLKQVIDWRPHAMTAQIAEKLLYQGERVAMCTNPLNDYFAMGGFNPRFESTSTALWRGQWCGEEIAQGDQRFVLRSPRC